MISRQYVSQLLFLVLLPFAYPALADADSTASADTVAAKAAVTTAIVTQKTLAETITAYGIVQPDPAEVHNIAMPGDGIVSRVFVRPGQIVKTGDAIIQIETSPGAAAQYDQAQAAVKYASNELTRIKEQLKEQLATRDQVAQAEKALVDAKAELDRLNKAGANKPQQTLRASVDGVVTKVLATPGDRLQADAITAAIGDRNALVVMLGIEVEDVPRLKPGAKVVLRSPLNPAIHIKTTVSSLHGMVNPATRLVDALVQLTPSDAKGLIFGMTMRATIALDSWTGPVVPRSALMVDESGPFVFTVINDTAHKVPVDIAYETNGETGLKSGVAEGDVVVVTGNAALEDGMSVQYAGKGGVSQ